jgi:anti-sigma factor RsiW
MAAPADTNVQPSGPGRREVAELSALADGTLDATRQAAVQARIADSVELTTLYERERRVVDLVHHARTATRAPATLRARIEAERGRRRGVRLRPAFGGALVAGLAAIVLTLVLVLPAGAPGAPSVSQAAALALRGSVAPAPAADPADPIDKLGRSVGHVYFPNWASTLGWRAVGQRVDQVNGRLAIIVYYERRGRQIAYTVLAAPALSQPQALISRIDGTELRTLRRNGRLVVTWRRAGHTCVLSGAGVSASELQKLAAWTPAAT